NRGTSGGALLNLKGELIGITTSLAVAAGYEKAGGFAIPVNDAFRHAVERLKQGRDVEAGFLGVAPSSLSPVERLAGKQGVRIRQRVRGTPADRAGMLEDDVITHINGRPIYDTDDLMREIGSRRVEETVEFTIRRYDP